MTFSEIITVCGFVVTIGTIVSGIAFLHGRGEEWRRATTAELGQIRDQLNADGGMGFVRRREIELLKEQADHEHEILGDRLRTLGDRTHRLNETVIVHGAEIAALKESKG